MTVDQAVEAFRSAATAFAQGNPEPVKSAYSHAEDVTLANPFGPAVRGWENVSAALDYASSRFSEGEVTEFKNVARYDSPDLVTYLDTEHWRTRVGGGDHAEFDLRVTSTYRKEDGEWKLVLRHADPISSAVAHRGQRYDLAAPQEPPQLDLLRRTVELGDGRSRCQRHHPRLAAGPCGLTTIAG